MAVAGWTGISEIQPTMPSSCGAREVKGRDAEHHIFLQKMSVFSYQEALPSPAV